MEEKEAVVSQVTELQRTREELVTDNRRLAEIVMTVEGESEEAAAMLGTLTNERQELRKQCLQLRESGTTECQLHVGRVQLVLVLSVCRVGTTEEGW